MGRKRVSVLEGRPLTRGEWAHVLQWVRAAKGCERGMGPDGWDAAIDGLIRAARKFDAQRGVKFGTYGVNGIRYKLRNRVATNRARALKYRVFLARMARLEEQRVEAAERLVEPWWTEHTPALRDAMETLTDREAAVLQWVYWGGGKLGTLASLLGVSKARIAQIKERALKQLRAAMGVDCE